MNFVKIAPVLVFGALLAGCASKASHDHCCNDGVHDAGHVHYDGHHHHGCNKGNSCFDGRHHDGHHHHGHHHDGYCPVPHRC